MLLYVCSQTVTHRYTTVSDNTCKLNHTALPQLQNICNTGTSATALPTVRCYKTPNTMYTAGFCLPNCLNTLGAGPPGEALLPDMSCFQKIPVFKSLSKSGKNVLDCAWETIVFVGVIVLQADLDFSGLQNLLSFCLECFKPAPVHLYSASRETLELKIKTAQCYI